MKILSIETSCDETSAAVVENLDESTVKVFSNITATSLAIHAATGGIIPENAAREQVKYILPTITSALLGSEGIKPVSKEQDFRKANEILRKNIDAIAITYGPGLIGSLLIGVETAKTLAYAFGKPIIPINHLLAHIFANFIKDSKKKIEFPFIGLIVSGGHTDLLLFKSITDYIWLGGTRDDAAGEALDKIGRLLNLPYPAGSEIERRAKNIEESKTNIKFQSPLIGSKDFDFSFSGLKAEVSRFVVKNKLTDELTDQICSAVQKAIFDVLIKKTIQACSRYNCSTILLGGGVSANQTLLENFRNATDAEVFSPEPKYSTDNGAMIGAYALLNPLIVPWGKIESTPDLYFA